MIKMSEYEIVVNNSEFKHIEEAISRSYSTSEVLNVFKKMGLYIITKKRSKDEYFRISKILEDGILCTDSLIFTNKDSKQAQRNTIKYTIIKNGDPFIFQTEIKA
jgi:hypothetical protein